MDSSLSTYRFVRVDEFTPNSGSPWVSFGNVSSIVQDPNNGPAFTITGYSPGNSHPAPVAKIYILGPAAVRVRFNPLNTTGDYSQDGSYAVVNKNLGSLAGVKVLSNTAQKLSVQLSTDVRLDVLCQPFTVQVYFKGKLISTDSAQGLVYLPGVEGAQAVANFKNYPANAYYFGFGEKGGNVLAMNQQSMTFFNYDNFKYSGSNNGSAAVVPSFSTPGPLNTAEPLYNSIPLLIEDNPDPLDENGNPTGVPYAYGLFLDNESQSYFNIGQSSSYAGNMYGKYYLGALYGEMDYYILAGNNTPEVLNLYTTLAGRAPLVAMWVLGYHQGCYGYFSQTQVMNAAQWYRAASIPLDGMHIDVDFQNNYRTFTASPEKFPGGGQPTFQQLQALGIKASTNITGIVTMVADDETGQPAPYSVLEEGTALDVFYKDIRVDSPPPSSPGYLVVNEAYGVDTGINPFQPTGSNLGTYGHYADLGRPEVREWWGTLYAPLLEAGLSMVWQDMTDPATQGSVSDSMPWKTLPLNLAVSDTTTDSTVSHAQVHNVFALNLISATYAGLLKLQPTKRPFIIGRGGYAGTHRYAANWTGDSASDWNFLEILIPEILNFGLSGQPLSGADVGGFATSSTSPSDPQNGTGLNGVTDPELLTRWTTLSAFIGWFRNHYDGYNKAFQEPYRYQEPYVSICRNYIEIRYKLLQYFYDSLYECTTNGSPICRPMFYDTGDRKDAQVYQHLNDQFFVGRNILVAPVINRGQAYRDVYLPAGSNWFAYTDNTAPLVGPSPGGQLINWYAPVNIVPIYVRAGSIIPHRELEQYVGQLAVNPLTFDIYPGADSTYLLYQDDGESTDAWTPQKVSAQATAYAVDKENVSTTTWGGQYRTTLLSQTGGQNIQSLSVKRIWDQYTPTAPYYFVAMLKTTPPMAVTVNGSSVPILQAGSDQASATALSNSTVDAAYYNQSLQATFVKVFDTNPDATIVGIF